MRAIAHGCPQMGATPAERHTLSDGCTRRGVCTAAPWACETQSPSSAREAVQWNAKRRRSTGGATRSACRLITTHGSRTDTHKKEFCTSLGMIPFVHVEATIADSNGGPSTIHQACASAASGRRISSCLRLPRNMRHWPLRPWHVWLPELMLAAVIVIASMPALAALPLAWVASRLLLPWYRCLRT